jgi:integrase
MRRAAGEGSIFERIDKRTGRRRFEAVISIGSGPYRKRRTVTGKTKKEVAARLRTLREQADIADLGADPITVGQLADQWWTTQRHSIEESTQSTRRERMLAHIINDRTINRIKVAELRTRHVEAWLAVKADAGYVRGGEHRRYSHSYLGLMRGDLHLLVEWAIREEWVRYNPVSKAKVPTRAPAREIKRTLTTEQAHCLIDTCLASTRVHANFTLVMLLTGCRPAEVLALTDDAVDYEAGTLRIGQAIKRRSGGRAVAIGETKTHRNRTFTVSDTVLNAIRREKVNVAKMRLAAGPNWCRDWDGLIFLTATGRPIWSSNLRRSVRALVTDAGIDIGDFDPYELRHSCASILAHAGVKVPDIIAQLGQRDDRMFWQHYFHRVDPIVRNAGIIERAVNSAD